MRKSSRSPLPGGVPVPAGVATVRTLLTRLTLLAGVALGAPTLSGWGGSSAEKSGGQDGAPRMA
jgi:hypothetical protein